MTLTISKPIPSKLKSLNRDEEMVTVAKALRDVLSESLRLELRQIVDDRFSEFSSELHAIKEEIHTKSLEQLQVSKESFERGLKQLDDRLSQAKENLAKESLDFIHGMVKEKEEIKEGARREMSEFQGKSMGFHLETRDTFLKRFEDFENKVLTNSSQHRLDTKSEMKGFQDWVVKDLQTERERRAKDWEMLTMEFKSIQDSIARDMEGLNKSNVSLVNNIRSEMKALQTSVSEEHTKQLSYVKAIEEDIGGQLQLVKEHGKDDLESLHNKVLAEVSSLLKDMPAPQVIVPSEAIKVVTEPSVVNLQQTVQPAEVAFKGDFNVTANIPPEAIKLDVIAKHQAVRKQVWCDKTGFIQAVDEFPLEGD